jgi:hypothetical protein
MGFLSVRLVFQRTRFILAERTQSGSAAVSATLTFPSFFAQNMTSAMARNRKGREELEP